MSTRSNKGIGLLLVEPLDLERVIHKSKRAVDTLQAAIGSVDIQVSNDNVYPVSNDTVEVLCAIFEVGSPSPADISMHLDLDTGIVDDRSSAWRCF